MTVQAEKSIIYNKPRLTALHAGIVTTPPLEDDFALRYVRIFPGVNGRAELVTLAPGLRPERRRWLGDYLQREL